MVVLVWWLLVLVSVAFASNVDVSLDFEQSIGDGPWVSRGKLRFVVNKEEKRISVKFENPTFTVSGQDVQLLNQSWMTVRIPMVNSLGEVVPDRYVVTSVRGCALIQDPKEVLHLLTEKTGALLALQYERPVASVCRSGAALPERIEVASKIVAVLSKEAPALAAPTYNLDKASRGSGKEGEDGDGENPPPQSFLQQYWHIILPSLVVYSILTAPQGPPPGDAAQGNEATTGADATAAAAAAAAATGATLAATSKKAGKSKKKRSAT